MAIEERPRTGHEMSLYYNTGTRAARVLVEIIRAINVSASCPKSEAAGGSRASQWRYKKGVMRELDITFNYERKAGTDAVFDALQAEAMSATPTGYEYLVLDGTSATEGAQGFAAFCELFDFSDTQDMEAFGEAEFVAKAIYREEAAAEVPPVWYEVPAP
jgi:hypothetical protein